MTATTTTTLRGPDLPADAHDPRMARAATGVLGAFNTAGVLEPADVHVATRIGRLGGEHRDDVLLALALAVRGLRLGSVCVDLAAVRRTVLGAGDEPVDVSALPWPEPASWVAACSASPLVADGARAPDGHPLRLVDGLLYLERYWRQEELVRIELAARTQAPARSAFDTSAPGGPAADDGDLARLRAGLDALFGAAGDPREDRQRLAAAVAALRPVTVLAGGPGTGKTTTVAKILTLLHDRPGPRMSDERTRRVFEEPTPPEGGSSVRTPPGGGPSVETPPRIALAAPTGKAAARLQAAVREAGGGDVPASTLHRLLGWQPGRGRFRHDRYDRLPYDVVVVDETSMVSLTMMARLLDAVRPDARLVLVGDPDQLASVEAGAVLGDLARAPGRPEPHLDAALAALGLPGGVVNGVVTLEHVWRFRGAIAEFARAVQAGDSDAAVALLRTGAHDLEFAETDSAAAPDAVRVDVVEAGVALTVAAAADDVPAALAALEHHRVLCGHRRGPYGVTRWSREIERWLAEALPPILGTDVAALGEWYPGRPVLVTANDYDTGLYNGDTGVVVATPDGPRVAFPGRAEPLAPSRLAEVATVHAMTVHRGQGSQFARVTVVLPPAESPLLTRELLYTAVTRAREFVRVVGSEAAVRAAVARPVSRASGLRHRLAR
jgi:exodeoxyribonuclease V alpha subunit